MRSKTPLYKITAIFEPMSFFPKVSIVIPVYNGTDFLSQAIDSALAQNYSNTEILVVNDGSDDGGETERIALSYGDKIRYFAKENGGVASALNVAIREMKGEYFSWLSHDDLYYSDKITSQIRALSGMNVQKTILYGDYGVFSENPKRIRAFTLPDVPPANFRYFITVNNTFHGCTLLIPRSAFIECGFFNEKLCTTQDYDLWFRMAEKYNFVHIPKLLVKSRQHAAQGSVTMKSTALLECNQLFYKFINRLSEHEIISATNKSISLSYVEIYASMLQRGLYKTAQFAMALAVKNMSKGSYLNMIRTIARLLIAKVVYAQVGLLRKLCARSRLIYRIKKCYYSSESNIVETSSGL